MQFLNNCHISDMFDSAVVLRGRACCQTSCGVSACRTWLWSTLMMICLCTHQTPAWDGTPWTKWAQGPARCPGPKALLHGRVRPRDTHTPTPLYWQLHTVTHICMNTYIQYILCKVSLRGLPLFMSRTETGRAKWSHVIFKALQDGRGRGRSVELGVKACDSSRRGGT